MALRVQMFNTHILTPSQYFNHYCPKPKKLIIGYMDPLDVLTARDFRQWLCHYLSETGGYQRSWLILFARALGKNLGAVVLQSSRFWELH